MMHHDLWTLLAEFSAILVPAGLILLVQSTVLVAAGLLAARLLRRYEAAVQSLVLRCALLGLLALPAVSWMLGSAGVSGLRFDAIARPGPGSDVMPAAPDASPRSTWLARQPQTTPTEPASAQDQAMPADSAPAELAGDVSGAAPPPVPHAHHEMKSSLMMTATAVWLAGATLLLLRQAIAIVLVLLARRMAQPAPREWTDLCVTVADRLDVSAPPVLMSDRVRAPCLVGWRRAAILLPPHPGQPREDVLQHELAHLKRGDTGWQTLVRIVAAVMWPQPLVWVLRRRLEQLADEVCDDLVIAYGGDPAGYARELVTLANKQQLGLMAAGPAVGVVAFRSAVARRVIRIMDRSRALSISAGRAAILLAALGAMCSTILIGAIGARANRPAGADVQVDEGEFIMVHGQVLDPDGRPVAGAKITAAVPRALWDRDLPRKPIAETTAGRDGRFELTFPKLAPFALGSGNPGHDLWKRTKIVVRADGFGVAWELWDETDEAGNLVLRLVPGMPVEGRVLDHEGRPVEGVNVQVLDFGPADRREAYRQHAGDHRAIERQGLGFPMEAMGLPAPATDADGRFRIGNVGPERSVSLLLNHPEIAYSRVDLVTGDMEPAVEQLEHPSGFIETIETYGSSFDYTADPAVSVIGTIRDESGRPIAGMPVTSRWFATPGNRGIRAEIIGRIETVTDNEGRYRLDGFPAGEGNQVIVVPTDDQPYFLYTKNVPDEPGPVTVDFTMSRAVWISGTVTDQATGQPLPVRVAYVPMSDNERAIEIPEYEEEGGARHSALAVYQSRYITRPDGSFRVPGVPGRGFVYVQDMSHRYRRGISLEELPWVQRDEHGWFNVYRPFPTPERFMNAAAQVQADDNGAHVDLQLDPGQSIMVTAIDPDGRPIGNLHVRGHVPEQYYAWTGEVVEPATFQAIGFAPEETRTMFLHHRQRGLGKATVISPADAVDGVITIQLEPVATITGRLIDPQRQPLAQMEVRSTADLPTRRDLPYHQTDEHGRFEITLLPGAGYTLYAASAARLPEHIQKLAEAVIPEPGGRIDLGEIQLEVGGDSD